MASKNGANGNNGSKWIRPEKRLAINLRDAHICCYCTKDLKGADPRDVTLDHIKPGHFAGNHHESNLITCCRSCNSSRRDLPLNRFASKEAIAHIRRNTRRSFKPYLRLAKAYFSNEVGQEENLKNLEINS